MRSTAWPRAAVFLDRDDTIIRDTGYLSDPAAIDILPGAARAVRALNEAGIPAIVITNQSGIARGFLDEDILQAIHQRLSRLLLDQGARIDAFYYCPHHPEGIREEYRMACTCRKPGPGLLLKASEDFGLDLRSCYLIGDKPIDIETIRRVGGKGILITTGGYEDMTDTPTFTARTIEEAVHWILKDMSA
jgi:D-glycero-D-manno-heptose 1,7-bisphosphate phosphatase